MKNQIVYEKKHLKKFQSVNFVNCELCEHASWLGGLLIGGVL